ncbi:putative dimethylaniline monooxygenase [Microdochium trichocladiopsis]|uniref:Dimethylaniline monooxygenase n=1 Tax=Microdochium trichocladiopsis TaxID=1682393 RepID=A0A9P8Y5F1_9PEZI|nr:putative dimethylaniline monooxygenase [Microdochium trichocladiopsis]KAH7027965.1 putative dimethylaniline monooxygenase [Microdochium trichocladiopsis]
MAATESYHVIVVGAGWYGLAAAKSYLAAHPDHRVLVIEAERTVGGTWSEDRLYPGLKSNNLWGSYEYPDFPMSQEVYGVGYGQHIPAAVLHRYLTDFAKKFGVFERIQFQTKVTAIEAVEATGAWRVHTTSVKPGSQGETAVFDTEKLIVASGLTSEPNLPRYNGQETFTSEFFHAKDFCRKADVVQTAKTAVVVGGGKSALDCAYALAVEGGATVHLIIRPKGDGPLWLAPAFVTPLKRMMEELLATRLLTWFSPTIFGGEDGYGGIRNFLHGTRLGNWLVKGFWGVLKADVLGAHGYAKHVEVGKLTPWQSPMWTGSGVGIHNYDSNFFDLVREGKVLIHVADIERLSGKSVYISTRGPKEPIEDVDVVICATGWKKDAAVAIRNFDVGLAAQDAEREKLIAEADAAVLREFPMLKDQPKLTYSRNSAPAEPTPNNNNTNTNTKGAGAKSEPLRNYRYIVPTQGFFGRSFAYAGMVSTVTTSIFASVQALWITAYFDGKLSRCPATEDEVVREVLLHTQWNKWRYPCGYGSSLPDFAFDSIPYVDLLVRDLGLDNHRGKSTVADVFKPYKPKDYAGLDQEWLASQQGRKAQAQVNGKV